MPSHLLMAINQQLSRNILKLNTVSRLRYLMKESIFPKKKFTHQILHKRTLRMG